MRVEYSKWFESSSISGSTGRLDGRIECRSAFHRTSGESLDQVGLRKPEQDDGRDDGEDCGCRHLAPPENEGATQALKRQSDRRGPLALRDHRDDQIVSPRHHKRVEGSYGDPWSGDGEDDPQEDLPEVASVDACRVFDILGQVVEIALEHPHGEWQHQHELPEHDAEDRVEKPDRIEHLIDRYQKEHDGEHLRGEDSHDVYVASSQGITAQSIRSDDRDDH